MNDLMTDARERLLRRARRDGLETVGYRVIDSPLGSLWIGAEPSRSELARIVRAYGPGVLPDMRRADPVTRELDQYFAGKRRSFDVAVDLTALTEFQRRVLRATAAVPFGDVSTYARVASRAGSDKAMRAAGQALGANPIPIVVPCHRILASDGTLGGYAGGLDAKRRLLSLERGAAPEGGWLRTRQM